MVLVRRPRLELDLVPPAKSIPSRKPRSGMPAIPASTTAVEIATQMRHFPRKSKWVPGLMISNGNSLLLDL
jgi:hypothetical protein